MSKYGMKVGTVISLQTLLCASISPGVQLLAGRALWTRLLMVNDLVAILLTASLTLVYVGVGGIRSAGILGMVKTGLLILGVGAGMVLILRDGGAPPLVVSGDGTGAKGMLSRGVLPGVAPGVSMMLGMLVNQSVFWRRWRQKSG